MVEIFIGLDWLAFNAVKNLTLRLCVAAHGIVHERTHQQTRLCDVRCGVNLVEFRNQVLREEVAPCRPTLCT